MRAPVPTSAGSAPSPGESPARTATANAATGGMSARQRFRSRASQRPSMHGVERDRAEREQHALRIAPPAFACPAPARPARSTARASTAPRARTAGTPAGNHAIVACDGRNSMRVSQYVLKLSIVAASSDPSRETRHTRQSAYPADGGQPRVEDHQRRRRQRHRQEQVQEVRRIQDRAFDVRQERLAAAGVRVPQRQGAVRGGFRWSRCGAGNASGRGRASGRWCPCGGTARRRGRPSRRG